ncbi:NUDIX domain-containing protein [Thioclava sp. SK-1]|uniref:NUDIX domain-containing protein n=1 Tax=Thioclava sp. SK-1 TaxID=1889770 RepID=UPI00159F0F0B|nr:NUDIX domain-containing protein [Thioclava sp. SK-1]
MTHQYFFYGTLSYPPLLARVLGRMPDMKPAYLDGYDPHVARQNGADLPFPILVKTPDGGTPGVLIETLTPQEDERLRIYEDGFGLHGVDVFLDGIEGPVPARVFLPDTDQWTPGDAWHLSDWCEHWGDIATEAAGDLIAALGQMAPRQAMARGPQMLLRAASRLRAQHIGQTAQRRFHASPQDVVVEDIAIPYAKFFAVEEYRLRHRKFSGTMSAPLERAVFVSGDAAVMLPYDPVRDRVLLIEQFRPGPLARGDHNPWLLEAIAGRIDPGETPEQAALREGAEEAGVVIDRLVAAPDFYPSPGAKSEYVYCYIGIADLPDGAAQAGGLEDEGEDIRPHLISFDELMALVDSGELNNGPALICAFALLRARADLRAQAATSPSK